jgi:uncharacterized protein (DUF58 family)
MVKEPEGEPAAHVWLVLDLDVDVQYGQDEGDSVELIVGAAGYLIRERLPVWVASGLLAVGAGTTVKPDARRGQAERMLDALAVAAPGKGNVEREVRALHAPVGSSRSTVIVVTPWADERWIRALAPLAHGGSTILCILLDTPDAGADLALDAQAAALRASGVQVYRHTAWAV